MTKIKNNFGIKSSVIAVYLSIQYIKYILVSKKS